MKTLLSWVILTVGIFSCSKYDKNITPPKAIQGVFDAREWAFENKNPISLSGEWEFYWNEIVYSGDEFTKEKKMFIQVPGIWNNTEIAGMKLGGEGYASYRLIVKTNSKTPLSLKRIHSDSAFDFFVNGKKIIQRNDFGVNEDSSHPSYYPQIVHLPFREDGAYEIIVHVSNFHHAKGGIREAILIGDEDEIANLREKNIFLDSFLFGSLLIIGLYHFGLYSLRRNDRSTLYFGFFCLLMGIRTLLTGEVLSSRLFHFLTWPVGLKIEYLTFYLGTPFFLFFLNSIFPRESKKILYRILLTVSVLFTLIVILAPAIIYTKTLNAMMVVTLIAILYITWVMVHAVKRKREGAKSFFTGLLVFIGCVVNDILYTSQIIYSSYLGTYGFFFFVFSQSFLLSVRFSKAFKKIEELSYDLEKQNEKLVNLDQLKDEFLANTSHELRTPLNGIIGIADSMIHGATGEISDIQKENLSLIKDSGKKLSNLVNDIMDFSKLKNHDLELNLHPLNLNQIVDVTLTICKSLLKGKNIILENKIPEKFPSVIADENRLQQILFNLIGNAIKFTDAGSVKVIVGTNGDHAEVSIIDTGIGISKEKQKEIFNAFEQVDSSISRIYGGTGLGLSISKKLIELQGGNIRVQSEESKGSTFTFTIPISRDTQISKSETLYGRSDFSEGEVNPSNKKTNFEIQKDLNSKKILVVDDESINIRVLVNQLNLEGYDIHSASSGLEALKLIEDGLCPELAILDVMMPRMNGYELCRHIRKKYSMTEMPILLLTARKQIRDIVAGFDAGANDFLSKPFEREELLKRIETLIELKRAVSNNEKFISYRKELEIATKIQKWILPDSFPEIPNIRYASLYLPMTEIGGDYYDFHWMGDEGLGVFIGDVSGHGIPAAMISAMTKIAFSMQKHNAKDPTLLLKGINEILVGKTARQFLTAAYMYYDTQTRIMKLSVAGHPAPIVLNRNTGEKFIPEIKGRVVGVFPDSEYKQVEYTLEKNTRVFLYTDGVIEILNRQNDIFGEKRVEEILQSSLNLDANEITLLFEKELSKWSGREVFNDDVTILVLDFA
ncbi:MAG: SpoIIE family protein phosphatase [Leptospiraceae bacterium]|nr:SpoIIE family protein phosphatase [Leptospiraceae bacterium]MCK6381251.1 SpoIIE family protein phosphatase [Leptospiraceae bacterium]NUM41403.1 SpoIIE family protein phosphatase [Leptospiraceae bacterium]